MLRHLKGSCYQRVKQVSSLYTNMCEKGVPERSSDELATTGDRTKLELMVFQLIFSQIRFLPALPLLTYPIFVQVTQLCHLYAHYTIYLWKYKSPLGLGSDGEGSYVCFQDFSFQFLFPWLLMWPYSQPGSALIGNSLRAQIYSIPKILLLSSSHQNSSPISAKWKRMSTLV